MRQGTDTTDREIRDRIAGRFDSRWLRGYVASKLATDPLYGAIHERLCGSELPLLDIGCGVGILSFFLRERGFAAPILGIDSDAEKIDAARKIASTMNDGTLRFEIRSAFDDLQFEGHVVVADVIHYMNDADQKALLWRIVTMIPVGGLAIIRDSPRDGTWRHGMTWIEEVFARSAGWMKTTVLNFPTREAIIEPFGDAFDHHVVPLWGRTPFNSHLFVFRKRDGGC